MTKAVDQILNGLEALITSEPSERNYTKLLLQQLRTLIAADLAAQIQLVSETEWLVLHGDAANEGPSRSESQNQLAQQLAKNCQAIEVTRSEMQSWVASDGTYVVTPIQPNTWQAGALLLRFSSEATVQLATLAPILMAFGELLMAHSIRWRSMRWLDQAAGLQSMMTNISECDTPQNLHFTLANDLRVYLKADSVTVWRTQSRNRLKLVSQSDCAVEPSEANLSSGFRKLAVEAISSGNVVSRTELLNEKMVRNWLAFGWPRNRKGATPEITIVAYWDDETRYADAIHKLRSSIVALESVTINVDRLLAIPLWGRRLSKTFRAYRTAVRILFFILAISVLGWLAWREIPFRIDGRASLEPVVQVNVFATHDGIIQELDVATGSKITEKQKLLQIRSAELDLEIEKLEGEVLALLEKRNGFQISLNQLSTDDPQGELARSQLSSEIIELDQREKQLKQLLQLQRGKRDGLTVVSPCNGIVVTDNVAELLANRPVKRGDTLVQIADISGSWHLKVEVPDHEAGHVKAAFDKNKDLVVRFRLASDPDREYQGHVSRITDSVRPGANQESVWTIYVSFDPADVPLRFGASVTVQFECGQRPTWYIWLRPLWENLRRRFWL